MEMLLLSFAGSMLAYFAFLSASSSAASAQAAAATNWPPTTAQQQALQVQISQLVAEVTQQPLTAQEQSNLSVLIAAAPAQYQATLPTGATPTMAGYQAWIMAGTAANTVAAMPTQYEGTNLPPGYPQPAASASGPMRAGPLPVPPNRQHMVGWGPLPVPYAPGPTRLYSYHPPDNMTIGEVQWDTWNDPYLQVWQGRMDGEGVRYPSV
jgi:hypothetical protein